MVLVRLHGVLKEEAGMSVVEVEGASLKEILEGLSATVKAVLERYRGYVVILVNGRRVYEPESVNSLAETDVVDLTLVLGGG